MMGWCSMFCGVVSCLCGAVGGMMGSVASCITSTFVGCGGGMMGFCGLWLCGCSMSFGGMRLFSRFFWRMVCCCRLVCRFIEGGFDYHLNLRG